MKISHEDLWDHVHQFIPNARYNGYALPEALRQCAVVIVRDDRGVRHGIHDAFIQLALQELHSVGFLTFNER